MEVLKINLENCYGINKLETELFFRQKDKLVPGSAYSIYAPNGFMKTSLARTFHDIQEGRESRDLIFPTRESKREITAEPDNAITPESVFVIRPYVEGYTASSTATLMVNSALRMEYEDSVRSIETAQASLLKELKTISNWPGKSLPIDEIRKIFGFDDVYEFFSETAKNLTDNTQFSELIYTEIFNEKTLSALKAGTLQKELQEYISKYQELVESSPLLSKKFNHSGASEVSKNLATNGFFEAQHSLNIHNGADKVEITSSKQLDELVNAEKSRILGDKELSAKFDSVDILLKKNAELKRFREYLSDHPEVLPELGDYENFRKEIWRSYFNKAKSNILEFSSAYESAEEIISRAFAQAQAEKTKWAEVVGQFNKRFHVPFKLEIKNQKDVILKGDAPKIFFEFHDREETCEVDEGQLLQVLSQGEKRALYILNILFEIQARRESSQPTLLIIDDLADSFDYKNKYAIIEYFSEIACLPTFKIVFLTHNFDFHRAICSRLHIKRERRLFARKTDENLSFVEEKYQNNPFIAWKANLSRDKACLVASIPFVRNLAEYCHGDKSPHYKTLTSLLHIKEDSERLTVKDLENIYKSTLTDQAGLSLPDPEHSVLSIIYDQAEKLVREANDHVELESKVILSIAIRLRAEEFMIRKINDNDFVLAIDSNQTAKLFSKYSEMYEGETEALGVIGQVNLMTPENIHLNSFMYEPILDMSSLHLYSLYRSVKNLV